MKRVVIFGGTGLIGNRLSQYMSIQGHDVCALGRSEKNHAVVFENFNTWRPFIKEGDYICFLIPFNMPSKNEDDQMEARHIFAMTALLNECVQKNIKHFLFISSGGAIYGRGNFPFKESDSTFPVSSYGKLKLKIEQLLEDFHLKHELSYCIARPSNVYSENQNPLISFGAITTFFYRISNGISLDIFGDLTICKDYLHLEDLVPVLSKMSLGEHTGIYNLGFGKTYTLGDIISKTEAFLNMKATLNFHQANSSDIHSYALDCTKARNDLAFHPQIDLDEGISRYKKII